MTQPAAGPLEGLTVIEMGTLIAGPFCGQILGDFGAQVIKIEDPKAGDPMRQWGRSLPKGHSPWWPVIGRNKKSVTLNLRTAEGQAIARKLIAGADVLVENFRPGALGIGAGLAEAGDPGHHQPGIVPRELLVGETPLFHGPGAEVFDQDVRLADQGAGDSLALRRAQVQRHRLLVAADHRPPGRVALGQAAAPLAHRIADPGVLDLDHLGPEVAEDLAGEGSGDQGAHLEDDQVGEGAGVWGAGVGRSGAGLVGHGLWEQGGAVLVKYLRRAGGVDARQAPA